MMDNKQVYLRGVMCGRLIFLLVVALELLIFCVGCSSCDSSDSGEPRL